MSDEIKELCNKRETGTRPKKSELFEVDPEEAIWKQGTESKRVGRKRGREKVGGKGDLG